MLSPHLWLLAASLWTAVTPWTQAPPPPAPCLAVMPATVTGVDGSASDAGTAVQELIVSFLTGPLMQPVPVEPRVRQLALDEARQKNCAFLLSTSLSRKRSGGGSALGSVLGRAAGTAAWYIPGGVGIGGAVVRGVSVGAAEAVQQMTSSTRAKDEMRLEWVLTPLAASGSATSRKDKLKASSDGEDLVTPLVHRAAETVVQIVLK